jgi:hypothetical protein
MHVKIDQLLEALNQHGHVFDNLGDVVNLAGKLDARLQAMELKISQLQGDMAVVKDMIRFK